MARSKTKDDDRDSTALSGDVALREWGKHERMRFGGYPTANILWLASHGGGRGDNHEPELPDHLKPIERAVLKLNPVSRAIIDHYYLRGRKQRTICDDLGMSRTAFYERLKYAQCFVAGAIS